MYSTGNDPKHWLNLIAEMVESGEYEWAEEKLLDIGETIERTDWATEGQIEAITNIYNKNNPND